MKGKLSTIILGALLIVAVYFAFIKGDNDGKAKEVTKSLKSDDVNNQNTTTNPVTIQPPVQNTTTPANGEPDEYGRLPGDEHYGHSHPPQDQQNQTTITPPSTQQNLEGGPDKYGRNPGEEHYGHDHP